MELAVVVGRGCLFGMAYAGRNSNDPYNPWVVVKEGYCGVFAQANGQIYGEEPDVAGEAVENASDARVLLSHASKLSVGAVEAVSPY